MSGAGMIIHEGTLDDFRFIKQFWVEDYQGGPPLGTFGTFYGGVFNPDGEHGAQIVRGFVRGWISYDIPSVRQVVESGRFHNIVTHGYKLQYFVYGLEVLALRYRKFLETSQQYERYQAHIRRQRELAQQRRITMQVIQGSRYWRQWQRRYQLNMTNNPDFFSFEMTAVAREEADAIRGEVSATYRFCRLFSTKFDTGDYV